MEKDRLSVVKVLDIMNLIVKEPVLKGKKSTIKEILSEILKDPRSRHVYIVNDKDQLIGSIRLNNVIEYMFPTTTLLDNSQSLKLISYMNTITANYADEIMISNPSFVYENTSLEEMIVIMTKEKINELPVIDKNRKVIGEVNVLEVIEYYLENITTI